jgi:putative transposase
LAGERVAVLEVLRSPRFVDKSPAQVWATLLDEGTYLCSISTMYRLLREAGEVRERRAQATHPAKVKPELVARAPNQVWSWDVTKLKGPDRGVYYDLFVMLDIYSRKAVHWMVSPAETAELAKAFIEEAFRGTAMTSKPVAQLLVGLNITRSHSRPRTSNDTPYSEAQFKTLKYCPAFPGRFGSLTDARSFCQRFFDYYNTEHRHSGIGLHTPRPCMTAPRPRSAPSGPRSSPTPTPPTRAGSTTSRPHPASHQPRGSTSHPRRTRQNKQPDVSHPV